MHVHENERERERERERELTTYLVDWRRQRKLTPTTALSHFHCTKEESEHFINIIFRRSLIVYCSCFILFNSCLNNMINRIMVKLLHLSLFIYLCHF
jgi:cytosine/adenosine deaminase-related metal-dependent hydrolase